MTVRQTLDKNRIKVDIDPNPKNEAICQMKEDLDSIRLQES